MCYHSARTAGIFLARSGAEEKQDQEGLSNHEEMAGPNGGAGTRREGEGETRWYQGTACRTDVPGAFGTKHRRSVCFFTQHGDRRSLNLMFVQMSGLSEMNFLAFSLPLVIRYVS